MLHLFLLAACAVEPAAAPAPKPGPSSPAPAPASPAPADDEPKEFTGTTGVTDHPSTAEGTVILGEVRAMPRKTFDRAVFTFASQVPGYHVEYVDKPVIQCGSGEPVPVAGDAWLEVRFTPAAAHTAEGKPTVPFDEQPLRLDVMSEVQRICDFEGVVTWVIGVKSPNAYRVVEKQDPPRIMIDIAH